MSKPSFLLTEVFRIVTAWGIGCIYIVLIILPKQSVTLQIMNLSGSSLILPLIADIVETKFLAR